MTYTDDQLRDLRDAIDAHLSGKPVEWTDGNDVWFTTLGQPRPRDGRFWRPKREPVTRPWNCPADVPMPVCWVRGVGTGGQVLQAMILNVSTIGFEHYSNDRSDRFIRWDETNKLARLQYSTTCRSDDWHPLTAPQQEQDSPFILPSEQKPNQNTKCH